MEKHNVVKSIQGLMSEMNGKLTEAIRCYEEGLVCPRESLNYIIDVVATTDYLSRLSTCDQDWKPCLLEEEIVCSGKRRPKDTDVVGKCDRCKQDVHPKEHFTKTGTLEGVIHNSFCEKPAKKSK